MKNSLTNSVIYQNRHILGFFAVAILLYFFIVFGFARTPMGLSASEMESAVFSAGFSFPDSILDLPYHFLQWASVSLTGISTFSLRLPSVLLALLAAGLVILAIRNFTRSNVAIITGALVASSAFFLNFARNGSPEIMSIFLLALAVFAISQIITQRKPRILWLGLLAVALALAVYIPMGVVFAVVLLAVAIISPKSRALLGQLRSWQIVLAVFVGLVALVPLAVSILMQPSLLPAILGIENIKYLPADVWTNIQIIFSPFGAQFGGLVTPLLTLGEIALVILGIVKLIRDGKSARTAFTISIAAVSMIITILDPTKAYLMFVPFVFLQAFGVAFIIDHWYKLFPLNPYARVLGLVPIAVLIVTMMMVGRGHYLSANFYNVQVVGERNQSFEVLRGEINSMSAHDITVVASESEKEFYRLLTKSYPLVTVTSLPDNKAKTQILLPSTFSLRANTTPTRVVTSSMSTDNLLLKIYEK